MKTFWLVTLTAVFITSLLLAGTVVTSETIPPVPGFGQTTRKTTMGAFASEQELKSYLRELAEKQRRSDRREADAAIGAYALMAEAPAPAKQSESVTNTQHAGVDEGGIVKVHGNHLVVLRRGRLFTVAIGDDALTPISAVDAFAPDIDPRMTWYDEMLIADETIVVIGYSYERGGTEVGLFHITEAGELSYRATYNLRSNDYYSSRNYASRLIGSKLIFYSPLYLNLGDKDPLASFPAVRKWVRGASEMDFRRTVSPTRVYHPRTDFDLNEGAALHTVTVCDLAKDGFNCEATAVIGPPGRVFYVSPDSVYVWASSWAAAEQNKALLFRMPLDGSAPSAVRVWGSPVDQFSFLQSEDKHLNVLVRSEAKGDGMWRAEVAEGDVALMRIPLSGFSDGTNFVPAAYYRPLPKPEGDTFQNRFVSEYLVYGTGRGWGYPQRKNPSNLFLADWKSGFTYQMTLAHSVDRIEQLGADAVVVGTDGKNLSFSSLRLSQTPEVVGRYTRANASQGELRSHGFFYKPDGETTGMLGLPVRGPGRPGFDHLFQDSAAILFLRNESLEFREIGELGSQPDKAVDDKCRASCIDWYGNARPLFLRGRVFALLGYEIVEGKVDDGRISEVRRVNYAPGPRYVTKGE